MWDHKCMATTKRGKSCGHVAKHAVWCFGLQLERFDRPTWVETCGLHLSDVQGWITHIDTAPYAKAKARVITCE